MPPKPDTKNKGTKSDSKKDGKASSSIPKGVVNLDEEWLYHSKK